MHKLDVMMLLAGSQVEKRLYLNNKKGHTVVFVFLYVKLLSYQLFFFLVNALTHRLTTSLPPNRRLEFCLPTELAACRLAQ